MSKYISDVCPFIMAFGLLNAFAGQRESYKVGSDVLPILAFKAGGSLVQTQDKTLKLSSSLGWTWAFLPDEIDINRYSRLTMSVKSTRACKVYLELKDKKGQRENALVGRDRKNNVWKVKVELPNTAGDFKEIVLDLSEHYRPDINDRLAKVIVFSDPSGEIEIRSIKFEQKQ
ncbi:MAG: hypothetical protein HZA46_01480 [Planctomycetales bacterium]|nr:hypothetical protein [Planctomycetales bacterium]